MKRLLTILTALVLVFCLCACSTSQTPASSTETETTEQQTTGGEEQNSGEDEFDLSDPSFREFYLMTLAHKSATVVTDCEHAEYELGYMSLEDDRVTALINMKNTSDEKIADIYPGEVVGLFFYLPEGQYTFKSGETYELALRGNDVNANRCHGEKFAITIN